MASKAHRSGPTVALIYANGLIQRGRSGESPLGGNKSLGADAGDRVPASERRRQRSRDPVPYQLPRRLGGRVGDDLGSDAARQEDRQAADRQHGRRRGVGRLLHRRVGQQDRCRAGNADGVDRRRRRQVPYRRPLRKARHHLGRGGDQRQCRARQRDRGFLPAAHDRFEHWLDLVYAGFKDRVARGRNLDADKVEAAAKGRVWTGETAKSLGLVDALGGFNDALNLAKEAAKIPPTAT